ncbi:ATP-binding cassette domain-containing protein [Oenococcus sp. UCMA 14587]|nr:ATP-binding cassette domain-containing protein [Oenococcus sp. UCMA 14587]
MTKVIQVTDLTKRYKESKQMSVDHISFSVDQGEFFAFLGPNGAGKTTTISILTTMLNKTSGRVEIAGHDLENDAAEVRKKIGIIFQKPTLDLRLTAEQNIRFHACLYGVYHYRPTYKMMPKTYKDQIHKLADVVGLEEDLFKPVRNLSGGMARKFEIMRTLFHVPKVLFLDEPSTGLDAASRRSLWNYINTVRKQTGMTVFLTTHYIDEAQSADQVCIINHGKIVVAGSPETMENSLRKRELILDAVNRRNLEEELNHLGVAYKQESHLIVSLDAQSLSAQLIISKLQTKLTVLKIKDPSLEDAYIEYLNQSGSEPI